MSDTAENIEYSTDTTITTSLDSSWKDALAGDNEEILESLNAYESPDKFLEEFNSLKNKNWRDDFAGEDEKLKNQLERFSTPSDFAKSYVEAQAKIRSGELAKPQVLPENATEEDIAKFREAQGIPATAEGYLEQLPEGVTLGEEDMPIAGFFMEALHSVNATPEVAQSLIKKYDEFVEQQQDELASMDMTHAQETEDALREAWKGDYRANVNLVGALIEKTFGAEHKAAILNARDPEGRAIFNNPAIMTGLADLSRQLNPINQIISPTGNPQQTLNDEIKELETYMRDNRTAYNKDQAAQDRLRQLYQIRIDSEGKT